MLAFPIYPPLLGRMETNPINIDEELSAFRSDWLQEVTGKALGSTVQSLHVDHDPVKASIEKATYPAEKALVGPIKFPVEKASAYSIKALDEKIDSSFQISTAKSALEMYNEATQFEKFYLFNAGLAKFLRL